MPGYDRSRIVGVSKEDLEEFICGICLEVLIKPTVTQCCGQTFCFDCINEWLQENNTCPYDRKCLTRDQLQNSAKIVTNLLSNMKINCDFHENGCNVIIKISELDKHKQTECDFNPLRKCNNCGHSILNHSDKECIKGLLQKLKILQEKHDQFEQKQVLLENQLIKKLNSLQKEYDQFRQQKEKDQTDTESYINEILLKLKILKEDYDQFQKEKSELLKYEYLQNEFNKTKLLNDSIKNENTELQNKISKLEEKNDFKFKMIGTLKWLNESKRFGFITSGDGGKDLFVHISAISSTGVRTLKVGQKLEFNIEHGFRGTAAANVVIIKEASSDEESD